MNVVVVGLGYVGTTLTACLLNDGHRVAAVDVDAERAAMIGRRLSPINEPCVGEYLQKGDLIADTRIGPHMLGADIVFVCVGTPSGPDGMPDLSALLSAIDSLGRAVGSSMPLIVVRSTVPPGTMDDHVVPLLARLAGEAGRRYEVAFCPEFLREGSAVVDFYGPARVVIGERKRGATCKLRGVFGHLGRPVFETTFRDAELVKYCDNAFHALKVAFANEVGRLARANGCDAQAVMRMFCADDRFNLSRKYLTPGGAFGGSCLPKDLRAVMALASRSGIRLPAIEAAIPSNQEHKRYLAGLVKEAASRTDRILLLGLSFKGRTGDMRESPLVELARTLKLDGYDIRIHDPDVRRQDTDADLQEHWTDDLEDCDLTVIGKSIGWTPRGRWLNLAAL